MHDITNLVLFARVIRAGSISAAARELGIPKSTLSRRLTDLEEQQSVRLLHRGTRQLTLTDVGREFLVHCQAVAAAAEAADQVTQKVQEVPRGELRFSCPYALSQSAMAKLLPEFMHRYPEVNVQLVATNRPVNLIEEGIDVALRVRSNIEDSSYIARTIGPSATSLYASPDLLKSHPSLSHPLDLLQLPTLSMHYTSGRYELQFLHHQGEQITLRHKPRLITDDMWVLRQAAVAGLGAVPLPDFLCADQVQAKRLVGVLPNWQLPAGVLHLVYPHRRGLLPAVRVFIDYLMAELPLVAGRHDLLTTP